MTAARDTVLTACQSMCCRCLVICLCFTAFPFSVLATDKLKADNNNALQLTTSWVGGSVPGSGDVAIWSNGVSAANCSNTWSSGTLDWGCIRVLDPATNVVVNFSLDSSKPILRGIDLSAADHDLTFQITAASPWQISLVGNLDVKAGRTATLFSPTGTTPIQAGSFTITNLGTVTFPCLLNLFNNGAVQNMSAGTLNANGFLMGWASSGTFNQSGGTFNVCNSLAMTIGDGCIYNLSGGTLNLSGNLVIQSSTMVIRGGTVSQAGGTFYLGNATSKIGTYVQSGNSVVTANVLRVASDGTVPTGNLTISNGVFRANSFQALCAVNSSTGHVWLAGGTAMLPAFPTTRGSGTYSDITFDGGTLVPLASTNRFLQGLDHAWLTTNGAAIDTANYDITINQILEDYPGQTGRLVKAGIGTLTLTATNTYSGATIITNGILDLAHEQCLSTNTSVWVWSGATNNLAFTGTNTIRSLYVDGTLQVAGEYDAAKLPLHITGSGCLLTLLGGPPRGTVVIIR
jgi:autotransporter-associated beta strand protein